MIFDCSCYSHFVSPDWPFFVRGFDVSDVFRLLCLWSFDGGQVHDYVFGIVWGKEG